MTNEQHEIMKDIIHTVKRIEKRQAKIYGMIKTLQRRHQLPKITKPLILEDKTIQQTEVKPVLWDGME